MSISDLEHLEQKITRIVSQMKTLMSENLTLKTRIEQLEKDTAAVSTENTEIRTKIETMIRLIDSIET
jgi:outer membrane murein-binding lipoprotein Lpp